MMLSAFATNTNGANMICQVGVVVIPRDVDREAYIKTFYSTGRLFIAMGAGEAYKNVEVSRHLIDYIVFPESKLDKGSPLLLVSPEKFPEALFAIGILSYPNELNGTAQEGNLENVKTYYGNISGATTDAKTPSYQVFVKSVNTGEGVFSFVLETPNANVLIRADASGALSFATSNKCSSFAQKEITHKILDSENNVLSEVQLNTEKITASLYKEGNVSSQMELTEKTANLQANGFGVKTDSENKKVSVGKTDTNYDSAVLGSKNNEILSEIIDTISNMQIITPAGNGVVDPASKAKFEAIKQKLATTLSKSIEIN